MRWNLPSLSKAQVMYRGQQSIFLSYTNINNQDVWLHRDLKDLGLAEGQRRKALRSLPQSHDIAAQLCCGSQHTDCELVWPENCKGVAVEESCSLLAGKQGGFCHCEANSKIYMMSEGLLFDYFPGEDNKLMWSLCSKRTSFWGFS